MKEKLSQKITSVEALTAVTVHWPDVLGVPVHSISKCLALSLPRLDLAVNWWMAREALRIKHGVYITTDVMDRLSSSIYQQHWLHVSTTDNNMVAYTPTVEHGKEDRQLTTTMGRYLRKYYLAYSDSQIASIEAEHRAELSGVFEIATTAKLISEVYQNMSGDSGCMRYGPEHFTLNHHPSEVYASPGMGVAYIASDEPGRYRARSVVWTNPDNPLDKRYVRVYGDAILAKLLIRNGYRCTDLSGAKLQAVRVDDGRLLMPYLDGPAGAQGHSDGHRMVFDGAYLTLLTRAEADKALVAFGEKCVVSGRTTAGCIRITKVYGTEFRSDLTGIVYSVYKSSQCFYLDENHYVKVCSASEIGSADIYLKKVTTLHEGEWVEVYCDELTPVFSRNYSATLDNEDNRLFAGYKRLSSKYYPEAGWVMRPVTTTDGHVIKEEDSIQCLPYDPLAPATMHHISEIKALRKLSYVNAYTSGKGKRLIHKMSPLLRKSDTGVTFADDYDHPYVNPYNSDVWTVARNCKDVNILGRTYKLLKTQDETAILDADLDESLENYRYTVQLREHINNAANLDSLGERFRSCINNTMANSGAFTPYQGNGVVYRFGYRYDQTLENTLGAITAIEASETAGVSEKRFLVYAKALVRFFEKHKAMAVQRIAEAAEAAAMRQLADDAADMNGSVQQLAEEATAMAGSTTLAACTIPYQRALDSTSVIISGGIYQSINTYQLAA